MEAISPFVARKFCELCDFAYAANQVHRSLFDDNVHAQPLQASIYGETLGITSAITQGYSLLTIAKPHDKAIVAGKITLGVEYIYDYGYWEGKEKTALGLLKVELDSFASKLRLARNSALSHIDLAVILSEQSVGSFDKNEDVAYFKTLQAFANVVSAAVLGREFKYSEGIGHASKIIARINGLLHQSAEA